jgi:predicted peroxiredoxin
MTGDRGRTTTEWEELMARTIVLHATHGKEDPERATLPFIVGNIAATADQEAVVLLTTEGVWLATRGYADTVCKEGFPPLREVLPAFVANGGQIWACGTCTKPRGITEADLIDGAKIVTAANVVEYMAGGAVTLSF